MTEMAFDGTLEGWRRAARRALALQQRPEDTTWISRRAAQGELALGADLVLEPEPDATPGRTVVPRAFLQLAAEVACHADASRWALLYRVLWRLTHGEPHLLEVPTDADVHNLQAMAKSVQREVHHMRAFVRFREVATADGPWFVAWFEPQHDIVELNAPFFRDRFASMCWSILTPDRCVHWNGRELAFSAGVPRHAAPAQDAVEDLWRAYYASTFNPARVSLAGLTTRLPPRFWKNLPEAPLIPSLVSEARPRAASMIEESARAMIGRETFGRAEIPASSDLAALREAARTCQACPLWRNATCTVFGEGPSSARVVFVGEQPGDQEDRQGQPFVGPAGQLLNRALAAAGLERSPYYFTNAVKHFKWEPQGKRRLHQKPTAREIAACRPWLSAELRALRPELIVCLGATAAQSVVARPVRVLSERGERVATEFGAPALITVHPSSLLRLPEGADPKAEFELFVSDLRRIHG